MHLQHYFSSIKFRLHLFQFILVASILYLGWSLYDNATINMAARNMEAGFNFLSVKAGFPILFSPFMDYSPAIHSYFDTFLIGLGNTLLVSFLGIITATIVGFIVGIARLSNNWLVNKLATFYVEIFRNIPLLLQITFWYFAVMIPMLPSPKQSITFFGNFLVLNNRGIYTPQPTGDSLTWILIGLIIAFIGIIIFVKWAKRHVEETGKKVPMTLPIIAILVGTPLLGYFLSGMELTLIYPEKGKFAYRGGMVIIPELTALWLALTIYTGAFIAENIRGGILAISHGQTEAALSLGLTKSQALRLVIIPQALRVIIPPQTSQYLNLAKNSSLASAVGYPDLVAVFAGTALNQIGRAIEIITMTMLVYLTISLSISALMNIYNRRIKLIER